MSMNDSWLRDTGPTVSIDCLVFKTFDFPFSLKLNFHNENYYLQFVVKNRITDTENPGSRIAGIDWNFNGYGGKSALLTLRFLFSDILYLSFVLEYYTFFVRFISPKEDINLSTRVSLQYCLSFLFLASFAYLFKCIIIFASDL